MQQKTKSASIAIIAVIYLIAAFVGYVVFHRLKGAMSELWTLFVADVVATIVVWFFGLVFRNVSVYDPYWSVAPPVMFTAWAIYKSTFTLPVILLLVAVWYWGIRLTVNWAFTFKGLSNEDWRYTRYRETQSPFLFQIINFFGLNMMPTVLVFVAMLPGFGLFDAVSSANLLTWLGFVICLMAATLQLVADTQIHRFRETHVGQYCDIGLWKHGRHPNYFGEITMWWGVWTMYASLYGLNWLIIGPVAMTALFLFVSIPMMERRQLQNKPGYAEYRKKTRRLI
jgi:steroid 5-alpha reductase family enzyme